MKWKTNALRRSYASYRVALTHDAGRVVVELGNSAVVVHRHHRELVKPMPSGGLPSGRGAADNVVLLPQASAA